MASREQKLKAGIFLLAGLALLAAIFIVVYMQGKQPYDYYTTEFTESVTGLRKDADVVYQGVPVGKVVDISIGNKNQVVVKLGIVPGKIVLRQGIQASLTIGNIMGGAIVELSGGDLQGKPLPPDSIIPTSPSILDNIQEDLPHILGDIRQILAKIDKAMGDTEEIKIPQLVSNTDAMIVTANKALQDISGLLDSSQSTLGTLEKETLMTMQSLRQAAREIARVAAQFSRDPSSIVRGSVEPDDPYAR
ncbi:MAG TPA: MlaD family protein [bacterium]|nr:MlaD family protein [bacterium]HPJ71072.1 MlaD family protein [bacterium]HPQ65852.1 MlaD family protein [bacterium]